ncbi:MAG TPA: hypothetical protein VK929_03135 [Longimicrobiales bacterium]|nr:hypothetical protein [Longimicrobiales bacterium]
MLNVGRRTWIALVVTLLMTTGCASGGPAMEGDSAAATEGTVLRVHNTDEAGQQLTIYLVPPVGEMKRIGTVAPQQYLTVTHEDGQGRFSLRAERPDGSRITSPTFNVVSGTYTWDIALRRVDRAR